MSRAPVQRMIDSVASANRWRDTLNPLRGLTMPRAVRHLEDAQRGIMANLQWCYESGIEPMDAVLSTIIQRRTGAVMDMEWQVEQLSDETTGFDQSLAEDQEGALREAYERIDNLYEAIGHLASAVFRGFAHLSPWYAEGDPLAINHLQPLNQWNMVRDGYAGAWAYDPEARHVPFSTLPATARLAPEEMIVIDLRRPVNRIALVAYVRANTSEKNWDAYVEAYGLPGVFMIAPAGTSDVEMEAFLEHANRAAAGGSGALPPGTEIKTNSEVRGVQPFQARLEWLEKQKVLAGTGGLLTVLTESGSGTLAGSVHEQAFRQLGRYDARRISEVLQRQLDKRILSAAFPGRPVLAYFELKARQEKNTSEFVKNVTALKQAGYVVDPDQISQETGLTIISIETPGVPAPFQGKRARACGKAGSSVAAFTAAEDGRAALEKLVENALEAGGQARGKALAPLAPWLAEVEALFAQTTLPEPEFLDRLQALARKLATIAPDYGPEAEVLYAAMSAALVNGIQTADAGRASGKSLARRQQSLAGGQE